MASFLALAVTARISMRQTQLIQAANHVSVILSVREERNKGFIERELSLVEEPAEHDPRLGFAGLPPALRVEAYYVSYFYLDMAFLIQHGYVGEDLAMWKATRGGITGASIGAGRILNETF